MKKLLIKILPPLYGQYFNVLVLFNQKKAAKSAFNLFCTIRKGRVNEKQKSFLDKAKKNVEIISNHEIQVYEWKGNGETVLLIHGWESNTFRWRNLIEKLQKSNFNIIAFDAPAHGYSSGKKLNVPLYSDCLQILIEKYQPKHLIGHSVGGMTILFNDHKHQNPKIDKMVTIGSPSEFKEIMEDYQNLLGFNGRVMRSLDSYVFNLFDMRITDFSSSKFVQTNTKKGLLFHDRLDTIAPYHASERVHKDWKNSQLISTEGLGHSMHQENINNKIVAFLQM